MRDQDELSGPRHQEALDPAYGGDVEIVGGLVEQKEIGLGNEDLGKVQPDLVAPGELQRAALHVLLRKTEAREHLLHLPMLLFPRFRQPLHPFSEHGVLGKVQMLPYIADAVISGYDDLPGVGCLFAHYHFQKRGFAVAVPAHQPHPLLRVDLEADVFEQDLPGVALGEILSAYHGDTI